MLVRLNAPNEIISSADFHIDEMGVGVLTIETHAKHLWYDYVLGVSPHTSYQYWMTKEGVLYDSVWLQAETKEDEVMLKLPRFERMEKTSLQILFYSPTTRIEYKVIDHCSGLPEAFRDAEMYVTE